jgi:hypothetical protein
MADLRCETHYVAPDGAREHESFALLIAQCPHPSAIKLVQPSRIRPRSSAVHLTSFHKLRPNLPGLAGCTAHKAESHSPLQSEIDHFDAASILIQDGILGFVDYQRQDRISISLKTKNHVAEHRQLDPLLSVFINVQIASGTISRSID